MPQTNEKLVLIYDTESTGLPAYKLPSEDPCQPHLVEIAALLYTESGVLVETFHALIKPESWVIPNEVIAVHGITNEMANEQGISEDIALNFFLDLNNKSDMRVAHHLSFDDRIMRIALKRHTTDSLADEFKAWPGECTALLAKPICQIPPTEAMKKTNFKNSFKTPNLEEAFFFCTGQPHEDAHRALADATACARVYFAIRGVRMPDYPEDLDHYTASRSKV